MYCSMYRDTSFSSHGVYRVQISRGDKNLYGTQYIIESVYNFFKNKYNP